MYMYTITINTFLFCNSACHGERPGGPGEGFSGLGGRWGSGDGSVLVTSSWSVCTMDYMYILILKAITISRENTVGIILPNQISLMWLQ